MQKTQVQQYKVSAAADNEIFVEIDGEIHSHMWRWELRYSRREGDALRIKLNSFGGSLLDAINICNELKSHPDVVVEVMGVAASAATVLCASAREILIHQGAFWMIHMPTVWLEGDAQFLENNAEMLRKMEATVIAMYTAMIRKRGKYADLSDEKLAEMLTAWMNAETWFTAEEAVEHGFCDRVIPMVGGSAISDESIYNLSQSSPKMSALKVPEKIQKIINMQKDKNESNAIMALLQRLVGNQAVAQEAPPAEAPATPVADPAPPAEAQTEAEPEPVSEEQAIAAAVQMLAAKGYTVAAGTPPQVAPTAVDPVADLVKMMAEQVTAQMKANAPSTSTPPPAKMTAPTGTPAAPLSAADRVRAKIAPAYNNMFTELFKKNNG